MGYSISWLAAQGKSPEAIRQSLGVQGTGKFGQYADFPIIGVMLPSNWYLLVAQRYDHKIVSDDVLAKASDNAPVVACSIEEHVMAVWASEWRNGKRLWRVKHDAQIARDHIEVSGALPLNFETIRGECAANQAAETKGEHEVDWFFDVPTRLAGSIVGFKHDEETRGLGENSFEILSAVGGDLRKSKKPWWRLF